MTLHQADPAPASASTALAGAAIQPGRPAFEAEEKAPVSSSIPERPRDDDDSDSFEELIELGDEALDAKEADHLEQEVRQSEPTRIAREGEEREEDGAGVGVAVPQAAEGTSALPVQAIVQGEEAGGRNVAPLKEERGREEEEERAEEPSRLQAEEIGRGERKVVREQVRHEEEEEEETSREEEAEIDLSEQLIDLEDQEENYR